MDEAWGLVSIEFNESSDPNTRPSLIEEALNLYNSLNEPQRFCILVHWRVATNKRFRDYCFSPDAIRYCEQLLVNQEVTFRQKPVNEEFSIAIGCRPSF